MLWALVGCGGQTPARTAFLTVAGANAAVTGVTDAAKLDPKFKAQLPALAPYVDAEKVAADSLDAAILSGTVDLTSYLTALNNAVTNLLNAKAKSAAAAATQP